MIKEYLYKVYRRSQTTIRQHVLDGTFEELKSTTFDTQWTAVGSLAKKTRNKLPSTGADVGYAIQMDGLTNRIETLAIGTPGYASPKNYQYGYGNEFTAVAYYDRSSWTGGGKEYIISHRPNGSSQFYLYIDFATGAIKGGVRLDGFFFFFTTLTLSTTIPPGTTGPVAFSIGTDGRYIRLFVNGVEDVFDTTAARTISDPGGRIILGAFESLSTTELATGRYHGFQFYDSYLSFAELEDIQDYYIQNNSVIAMYEFNEGSGSALASKGVDNFSNSFISGTPQWVAGTISKDTSVYLATSAGGGTTQGLKQASGYECIVKPSTTYTLACEVLTQTSHTVTLRGVENNGGPTNSVSGNSLVANEWRTLVIKFTTAATTSKVTIEMVDTNANAGGKNWRVDKIRLIEGSTDHGYFDDDVRPPAALSYRFDPLGQYHEYLANTKAYIKTWSDVITEPNFEQEINNAGSALNITLGRNSDNSGEHDDLDFGNEVMVYCVDDQAINGQVIFDGRIENYRNSETDNNIAVTLFGFGSELDRYIMRAGENRFGLMPIYRQSKSLNAAYGAVVTGVFTLTEDKLLSSMKLKFSGSNILLGNMEIYQGDPTLNQYDVISGVGTLTVDSSNTFIGSSTKEPTVNTSDPTEQTWEFNSLKLNHDVQYYWQIVLNGNATIYGAGAAESTIVGDYEPFGRTYIITASVNNTSYFFSPDNTFPMVYAEIYEKEGSTTARFNSVDPAIMLRTMLDQYQRQGGAITYTEDSIPLTGTVASYDFITMTLLEVLDKCLELAPVGHYYYIDQGTNILYFKAKSAVADHIFTVGEDIYEFNPEKRSEDIVNAILFTGGDIDGNNLFKEYRDEGSISTYGLRTLKYTDGRVTLAATAKTIAERILATRAFIEVRLDVTVLDNYDLETINVGDVVGFRNTGDGARVSSLWDRGYWDEAYWDFDVTNPSTFVLQIARLSYTPNFVRMTLSTVPPDVNKRIEEINRNLDASLTLANPDSPS